MVKICFMSFSRPTMDPKVDAVRIQTELVMFYLLADKDEIDARMLDASSVEPDCSEDSFDPVIIADRLRSIGDALNEDIKFKTALKDLAQEATNKTLESVFSRGVETLCESYASKGSEVAPELQLIKASVTLGLYMKKISPDLKDKVKDAMTVFLNNRVSAWVAQQGGWDKVPVSM
ncbi:bcl-2-like protein 15 [Anableps anableps]